MTSVSVIAAAVAVVGKFCGAMVIPPYSRSAAEATPGTTSMNKIRLARAARIRFAMGCRYFMMVFQSNSAANN